MNKPPDIIKSPNRKRIKRVWSNIPENSNNFETQQGINKNKFLIIENTEEGDLKKVSPFLISKSINNHCGEPKNIKKLRNGTLLVETKSHEQSEKLLKLKNFGPSIKIKVSPHEKLNVSKGIIYCQDLDELDEKEILEELNDQKVIEIKRIISKKRA